MELGKEYFGPLWKYIANEEITDVDYNGREIWLTNIYNERYRVNQAYVDENMTLAFVEQFTQRIANVVSQQFNKQNPELEAETSELRVTVLHESIARSGRQYQHPENTAGHSADSRKGTAGTVLQQGYSCSTGQLRADENESDFLRDAGNWKDGVCKIFFPICSGK